MGKATSLHSAYKVTLIASLKREGFRSAIIPVGPIGHLVLCIDLPSFGQYSIEMYRDNDEGNRNYALGLALTELS